MVKINIVISEHIERQFREAVAKHKGLRKGNLSKAVEEALVNWIDYKAQSTPVRSKKTEIEF